MKSYLSLIPISARVRRRQNRLTILCIVTAVFLVTAIFSVADMMLCTQTGRAAGKSGSWHLEVTGITPEQAAQLVGQPDVVRVGAGAVFNENGESAYRLNGKRVVLYGADADYVSLNRAAAFAGTYPQADLATDDVIMQDLRESNRQDRGTYYAVRIVLYGFLAIIGGISLLNIVNSISMSVSARARQYGAMRAVGMEDVQLCRMIAAEAGTYAASGLLVGVAAGLVLHRALYTRLITHYFGVVWRVPFGLLAVLCLFVAGAAALAVHGPVKRLQAMPVTAAINEL